MRHFTKIEGVPDYDCGELKPKLSDYCVLIPVLNEGERIRAELSRAFAAGIHEEADIAICDGNSQDGSLDIQMLEGYGVNSLLIKTGPGRQGAQLRTGIHWGIERGYRGFITIDGNNKDSIEDVPRFIAKLKEGYDFVQGSRFIDGGYAENTPLIRLLSVKLIHAPVISITARYHFTDTTNAFRGYSRRYLTDERVKPLRDVFVSYELLAYLSVRASQLGMRVCEIPVSRVYPKQGRTPTKISALGGNLELLKILARNFMGKYHPSKH
ncbi:MAG: glycosyltransferase family 2 protein [Synergistaceae bacterium]|nr:glycosyltransferase family 2 protein [Synergistaceae bacterium]